MPHSCLHALPQACADSFLGIQGPSVPFAACTFCVLLAGLVLSSNAHLLINQCIACDLCAVDCKGICNAPASPYIFRMALPTVQEALAGKWKTWRWSSNKPYETMPIP